MWISFFCYAVWTRQAMSEIYFVYISVHFCALQAIASSRSFTSNLSDFCISFDFRCILWYSQFPSSVSAFAISECNHTECKPCRSSARTRTRASIRTRTNNWDKSVNTNHVKVKDKSSIDREGHSRDLMRCKHHPLALSRSHIHAAPFISSYTNAFSQERVWSRCHHIHATAFTLYSICM